MVSNIKLVSNTVSSKITGLEHGLERLRVSSLEVSSKIVSSLGLESMVSSLGLVSISLVLILLSEKRPDNASIP